MNTEPHNQLLFEGVRIIQLCPFSETGLITLSDLDDNGLTSKEIQDRLHFDSELQAQISVTNGTIRHSLCDIAHNEKYIKQFLNDKHIIRLLTDVQLNIVESIKRNQLKGPCALLPLTIHAEFCAYIIDNLRLSMTREKFIERFVATNFCVNLFLGSPPDIAFRVKYKNDSLSDLHDTLATLLTNIKELELEPSMITVWKKWFLDK